MNLEPVNRFKTCAGSGQVWVASQVHLHRPCSTSNRQSRVVMTGCCCHRAVRTHRHTHTGAQTAITQKDTCTHSQTSNVLTRQAFCFLTHSPSVCLSPSTTQTFSHLTPPHLAGQLKQQLCSYISSSQPVCKPADPSHNDQCNGQTRVQNKERMQTVLLFLFQL